MNNRPTYIKRIAIQAALIALLPLLGFSTTGINNKDSVAYFPVFKIHSIYGINTHGLDFSPVVLDSQLIFVTEREIDFLNYGESRFDADSYLSIHISELANKSRPDSAIYTPPKLYSNRISQLNHSGPITFNGSGDYAVFTRVKLYKTANGKVYRPQLFSAKKEKGKWKDIQLLDFNIPEYAFGHPALSTDGKTLYFVSNMDGGYGANDLYFTTWVDSGWSTPVNLGEDINTFGNEVFPFQYKDSLLFFSSNGHPGLGGLDLFFTTITGDSTGIAIHLDHSINTQADEFGIFLDPNKQNGYLSSNRQEGMGNDDIYGLTVDWVDIRSKIKTLKGYFAYRTLPDKRHSGLQVYLINENGDIIYSTLTDENGYFSFSKLPFDISYKIKTETVVNEDILLFLLDEAGNITSELTSDKDHIFFYKKLSYKDIENLQLIYSVDTIKMLDGQYRKTLSGQMTYRNLPYSEGKGLKVYLLNEEGEVVHSTFADENGLFYFKNLPFEDSYTIMTEELLPGIKLIITNQGVVVAVLKSDEEGKYVYLKLPYMGIQDIGQMDFGDVDFTMFEGHKENTTLTGTMVYRNLPFKKGAGMKIYLLNKEGEIVFTTIADKNGRFVFTNLPYGNSYMIRMEENNEEIKINITNNGKVISVLTTNKAGLYSFTMLPFMDVSELEMMSFNQEQLTLYRGSPGEGVDPDINNALVLSEDNKLAFIYDVLDHKKTILTEIENDLNPTLCPETAELTIKEIDDCIDITIEELLAASEKPKSAEPQKEELAKPEPEPEQDKKYNASATISQDAFAMVAVYFDFNRFNLTIPAKTILADVITMMTREKNLVLNIHGYSDSKGSDSHNLVLSKNRAKKIYDYLTTNGLAKSRMNTNWYGKEKQAEKCGEECTDNQDQLNRRVEIVPSLY